jgi:hypothetical protein
VAGARPWLRRAAALTADGVARDVVDVQQQVATPELVYPHLPRRLGFG